MIGLIAAQLRSPGAVRCSSSSLRIELLGFGQAGRLPELGDRRRGVHRSDRRALADRRKAVSPAFIVGSSSGAPARHRALACGRRVAILCSGSSASATRSRRLRDHAHSAHGSRRGARARLRCHSDAHARVDGDRRRLAPVLIAWLGVEAAMIVDGRAPSRARVLGGGRPHRRPPRRPKPTNCGLTSVPDLLAASGGRSSSSRTPRPLRLDAGTVVREGDAGDRFYIVAEGDRRGLAGRRAFASSTPAGTSARSHFSRHDAHGDGRRRETNAVLYALDRDDFLAAVTGHPQRAEAAEKVVSARLAGPAASGTPEGRLRHARCARQDSNLRPLPPQGSALSPELRARGRQSGCLTERVPRRSTASPGTSTRT